VIDLKNIIKINIIALIGIICDQIIKFIITHNMNTYETIKIINNFFNITYVQNEGAAWSILTGKQFFLIGFAIIMIIILNIYLYKNKNIDKLETLMYGLLIGGIIGNLIDRIIFGYVIDYLDFKIFGYDFPIFNLADILICTSAFVLIIKTFIKGDENEVSSN